MQLYTLVKKLSFLQFCDIWIGHIFMYYFLHMSWKFWEIPGHLWKIVHEIMPYPVE